MVMIKKPLKILLALTFVFHSALMADSGTESSVTYVPPLQPPSQGTGSSGQSDMAKAQQILGAGMNAATGAMMQKQCNECNGSCNWACAMAAMSYAQAVLMGLAALQSEDTENSATASEFCYSPPCDEGVSDDSNSKTLDLGAGVDGESGSGKQALEAPFTPASIPSSVWPYDPETGVLSTPQGPIEIEPDATPSQIAEALGGSPSDMKMAESLALRLGQEAMKALEEEGKIKPSVSGMGVESYGGGGGSSYHSGGGGSQSLSDLLGGYNRKPSAAHSKIFKKGKSRLLNGEEIGIKMDNIFAMVHRRYQSKRKANGFLETIITNNKK